MKLKDFISAHHVSYYADTIDSALLKEAERAVGVQFGIELIEYLFKYGYLAYEYMALYGMNTRQGLDSELVKQTLYMHKYYPETSKMIAIENQGDGDYFVVNSEDDVFEYDTDIKELRPIGKKLSEYLIIRLENVQQTIESE